MQMRGQRDPLARARKHGIGAELHRAENQSEKKNQAGEHTLDSRRPRSIGQNFTVKLRSARVSVRFSGARPSWYRYCRAESVSKLDEFGS